VIRHGETTASLGIIDAATNGNRQRCYDENNTIAGAQIQKNPDFHDFVRKFSAALLICNDGEAR